MDSEKLRPTRRAFLQGVTLGGAAVVLGESGIAAAGGARLSKLPRTHPEAVGIDPAGVIAFVDAVERKVNGLHSFMLLRHGRVAAEAWWAPYAPQHPHMLFSLSKSFTSTGIGLAVSEGRLTVDAPVVSFFPERAPSTVGENLAAMRVRHLLTMSTGHDKDATGPTRAAGDGDWVRAFLSLPVEHAPGSKFVYNSAATYMLSAIVQKLTGMTLLDYIKPRLFGPLGIEGETWETCPRSINTGGWGLSVKTEDIARFGQLYLQKGKWEGRQLLAESWIDEATTKQVSNGMGDASDWTQGYGYQFWRCRHDVYRGDGAFGQYCVVMQPHDAVLAITSAVGDMQAVLNAVWEHLLPAMKPAPVHSSDASTDLKPRLAKLSIPPPVGTPSSPTANRVSGKTYRLDSNDEKLEFAALTFDGGKAHFTLRASGAEQHVACKSNDWLLGNTTLGNAFPTLGRSIPGKVAARGAWTAEDTFTMHVCFYETPFTLTVTCKFTGDQLTVDRKMNLGFGPTARPPLTGKCMLT